VGGGGGWGGRAPPPHHTLELKTDWAVREELGEHVPAVRTTLDDQLRHVPAAAALGLSLAGVRGEHSTVNQALLFALTYTINNTLTSNLKRLTRVERPYGGGDYSSFPSQHASAAYSAAWLLDREYGTRSGWYRVGGYTVATSVAALRLINGKHWLSDVVTGAGIMSFMCEGLLSLTNRVC
jgi:membrane-associated phospholipid phosphatase